MNNHKIRVLFVIALNRIKKNNKAPLYCRVTYNKKRKQFATGVFISPKDWNNTSQSVKSTEPNFKLLNTQLSLIHQQIDKAFLFLQISSENFDVDDIYRKYKGEDVKTEITILGAYDLHNDKTKKLIGVDFNELSWSRYVESRRKVASFITKFYKRKDVKLKDLDLKFIKDLEYYFKTELHLKQATIYRSMQRVKKIVHFAIAENYLQRDPFSLYKNKKYKTKIIYLSVEELDKLEKYNFNQLRLQKVKDLFVFCCYTGLAYLEMSTFTTKHIKIGFDGNEWIEMNRQKTDVTISVPLFPKAKAILVKYNNELPKISNQRFNSYLREIAEVLEIEKKLTHHIARKTFATTVLLCNGVSMEVVSKLLGHSKVAITQEHYAKIVNKRVSDEIGELLKVSRRNKFDRIK